MTVSSPTGEAWEAAAVDGRLDSATDDPSQSSSPSPSVRKPKERLQPEEHSVSPSSSLVLASTTSSTSSSSSSSPPSRPPPRPSASAIPLSLLTDAALNAAILSSLPPHYNFEVHKTIHRLLLHRSRRVALQLPEGLLAYSLLLSDLLTSHTGAEVVVLGDVTYGACCVDDFTAKALGCDALVHYGHSCLVPIDVTGNADGFMTLYVFVDIHIDLQHLTSTLQAAFDRHAPLTLASTIQFASALQAVAPALAEHFPRVDIPQAKPLSRGEVLGCTSPQLPEALGEEGGAVVFVADGRFHLESLMIHNPHVRAFFKYDPYSRKLTREAFDHAAMHGLRQAAIAQAAASSHWGLILGTLGRQGAPHLLRRLQSLLSARGATYTTFLLSEITPAKLALLSGEERGSPGAFVQVACPRLSVDWGHEFGVPVLNGYEAEVALGEVGWRTVYPMDHYADAGGAWSNYAEREAQRREDKGRRDKERKQREAKREEKRRLKEERGRLGAGVEFASPSGSIAYEDG